MVGILRKAEGVIIAGDSAGSRGSTQSAAVRELPVSCSLGSRQRKR